MCEYSLKLEKVAVSAALPLESHDPAVVLGFSYEASSANSLYFNKIGRCMVQLNE